MKKLALMPGYREKRDELKGQLFASRQPEKEIAQQPYALDPPR
jgi:hypothetical protein